MGVRSLLELFLSGGKPPEDRKEPQMGKKDGKPEPQDIGSNMKIKVSKETQKKIQESKKKK